MHPIDYNSNKKRGGGFAAAPFLFKYQSTGCIGAPLESMVKPGLAQGFRGVHRVSMEMVNISWNMVRFQGWVIRSYCSISCIIDDKKQNILFLLQPC